MPITFTPAQIEQLKLRAKSISRLNCVSHGVALDKLAHENGYSNWSLLMKHAVPAGGIQLSSKNVGVRAQDSHKELGRPSSVDRLVTAGFTQAGRWTLANQILRLVLDPGVMHEQNVLYAFVVSGRLMYVGKTTQSLLKRMQGYRSPANSAERGGSTNIKNNRNIIDALMAGANVDIYVLHTLPIPHHGEFPVNLAAGLEDSLIRTLAPPWNGKSLAPATNPKQASSLANEQTEEAAKPSAPAMIPPVPAKYSSSAPNVYGNGQFPSAETLMAFCKNKRGELMTTIARKNPFRVEVVGTWLEITPGSSKVPRREPQSNIALLLSQLAKTHSFQMSDYRDVTFNASYVLAIVKAWQQEMRAA